MQTIFHTRKLTFRQLDIFRTVADLNSVSEAAKQLHLAQPTVSTQLAKLAQNMNAAVFEQVGKRLYLTDAGKDLYAACENIFEQLDNLETRLAQRAGLSYGRLRISAVTTAKYLVPEWLGSFYRKFPEIEPEFHIGNRAEIISRLNRNLDDFYIFSHPPGELEIDMQEIASNPLVIIAPTEHYLAARKGLHWEDVKNARFLIREKGSGTRFAIERFFKSAGYPQDNPITIASNEAIKEAVVAGLGVAIISSLALSHMRPGNLVELDVKGFPLQSSWYLVTAKNKALTPVTQAFREHLGLMC